MPKIVDRIGETNINFQGLKMTVISYRKAIDISVKFEDGTIVEKTAYNEFTTGSIKNVNYPWVYGKGFMGQGKYIAWGGKGLTKVYSTWFGMMTRCYSEKSYKKYPTYKDVTVCEEWHNFQNFAKWYEENYVEGWQLDKDIICPECRMYSPETCVFVPQEINGMFTSGSKTKRNLPIGVYYLRGRYQVSTPTNNGKTYIGFYKDLSEAMLAHKTAKERYMKEAADKWKDQIDERVYNALYSYTVNIDD